MTSPDDSAARGPAGAGPARAVSLTTDIGEGFGHWRLADDDSLLGIVTGANIACGFHAGDPDIMRRTCATAVANGVSIGAQVSYRDLAGFGRRFLDVARETLTNDILYQMGALAAFAAAAGGKVDYVRAHGALYNVSAKHSEHAAAIVEATRLFDTDLPLLCQTGTETWRQAQEAGIRTVAEAFVDRAYTSEGLLVPRTEPDAMLSDPGKRLPGPWTWCSRDGSTQSTGHQYESRQMRCWSTATPLARWRSPGPPGRPWWMQASS